MLVLDSNTEASRGIMPFGRRKRTHSASVRNNQVEAQGEAWLCFAEDHSWFQGNINTDDESNYSLCGRRYTETVNSNSEDDSLEEELDDHLNQLRISNSGGGGSCGETTESSDGELEPNNNNVPKGLKITNISSRSRKSSDCQEYYSVSLTDHFSGLRYQLPRISVNNNQPDGADKNNLFLCAEGQVSFEVHNVFKGQKADMMIQQHIGSPSLLGQKCFVYTGPMNIVVNDVLENGRSWCL